MLVVTVYCWMDSNASNIGYNYLSSSNRQIQTDICEHMYFWNHKSYQVTCVLFWASNCFSYWICYMTWGVCSCKCTSWLNACAHSDVVATHLVAIDAKPCCLLKHKLYHSQQCTGDTNTPLCTITHMVTTVVVCI